MRLPIVSCPKCSLAMTVAAVKPSIVTESIEEMTYACRACNERVTRKFR